MPPRVTSATLLALQFLSVCLVIGATARALGGPLDFLRAPRQLEIITVTDATDGGRAWPAPTLQQPQYYRAVSLGYRDLGGAVARVQQPPEDTAVRIIAHELAKLGYLPASDQTPPPTLVLVFAWGTLNADTLPPALPGAPPMQKNRHQIEQFLGGNKVGLPDRRSAGEILPSSLARRWLDFDARALHAAADENYYVAVVTAYDLEAMRRNPTISLDHLWITRIACPSNGFALPDVLPDMLALAGPHLGRETARPVRTTAPGSPHGRTKYGELKVIEYLKESPPATTPSTR